MIEGVFGQYHAQTTAHRKLIEDQQSAADENWYKREILDHITAIEAIKGPVAGNGADWSFKAIFQKSLIRLARLVEFEQKGDPVLGKVEDIISLLDALYDKGILKIDRPLPEHEYGLWAFIATNPVGGKIKVRKSTEDRLLAILRLWYYANRKIVQDAALEEPKRWTVRKLVAFFDTATAVSTWPKCKDDVELLHRAIDTAVLHGKDPTQVKERARKNKVRERLSEVLRAGIIAPIESDDSDRAGADE